MIPFRTKIKPKKGSNQIDYTSKILLIGSCFTENIGDKLKHFKFTNNVNPFGILFHPKAIENLIVASLTNKVYTEKDLVFYNERWHCFDAHSVISNTNKETVLSNLNNIVTDTKAYLKSASHIIITLGTAWVYNHLASDNLVANCHKIPQKEFHKKILSVNEIVQSLAKSIQLIKEVNSKATIIFTVSPVRHLKDGFIENTQSKAHLIAAIHQVNENYFPSYEIMLDDLRDYRFYKKDMLHPNETAIDYIWEKFSKNWINEASNHLMKEVNQIQKGLSHKPFNATSEQHQCFLRDLQIRIDELEMAFGITF